MNTAKQILIGGQALVKLGSSRTTQDTDYLVDMPEFKSAFLHDKSANVDYINASGNKFFAEIWEAEKNNNGEIATPQSLLELKAYSFVQHCLNGFWNKANEAEYDMKFLVLTFGLSEVKVVNKYISNGELEEVNKVIKSAKRN